MQTESEQSPLLIGVVGLVRRLKVPGDGPVIVRVRDEIRTALRASNYFSTAPFKTVSLIFRYGSQDNLEPDGYKVARKTSELHTAVEFDGLALKLLDDRQLEAKFRTAVIDVLCDIAANFDLPYKFLDEMRRPATAAQMQAL